MDKQLGTITEEATKALEQIAAKKKAKEALEQLRRELANAEQEIGTDPATPESLQSLGQQIRESEAELEAIPEELRQTENYQIAEQAHNLLKAEWSAQDRKITVQAMLTELIESTAGLREQLKNGQNQIDGIAELNSGYSRFVGKFFARYTEILMPALNKCLEAAKQDKSA